MQNHGRAKTAAFYDYLEIQPPENQTDDPNDYAELQKHIIATLHLSHETGIPSCAVSNASFLNPEDSIGLSILRYNAGEADAENQFPLYVRTTEEMLLSFSFLGEEAARQIVIENTNAIANKVEDCLPLCPGLPKGKKTVMPYWANAEKEVTAIIWQRAHEIYGNELPAIIIDRLKAEENLITHQNS